MLPVVVHLVNVEVGTWRRRVLNAPGCPPLGNGSSRRRESFVDAIALMAKPAYHLPALGP
jgi:hypothetical protein